MIRGNLATRPFYNEGAVQRLLAIATLAVLALTAYNGWQLATHSRSDAALRAEADADEARAAELRAAAAALRRGQDDGEARRMGTAAREANAVIASRTFSWTSLFNRLESALPAEVRITAVRPAGETGASRTMLINVVARSVGAVDAFMQNLEDSGAFRNALARDEAVSQTGEIEAAIEVQYLPGAGGVMP